jgi:hypothetical protein
MQVAVEQIPEPTKVDRMVALGLTMTDAEIATATFIIINQRPAESPLKNVLPGFAVLAEQ